MATESKKIGAHAPNVTTPKKCHFCKHFSPTDRRKGQGLCRIYEARHPQPIDYDPITHQPVVAGPQQQLQVYFYFKCGQPQFFTPIKR